MKKRCRRHHGHCPPPHHGDETFSPAGNAGSYATVVIPKKSDLYWAIIRLLNLRQRDLDKWQASLNAVRAAVEAHVP